MMRLFIGIDLPKSFKGELIRLQRELKGMSASGRFVPTDSFHITLHFIGESDDLSGAVAAMHEAVRGIRKFTLHLGRYSSFIKGKRTSIVEVKGDLDELNTLHEALESALSDAGFSRENKKYVPHITLGRSVEHDDMVDAELAAIPLNASLMVDSITLFLSERREGRVVYTPLHKERF